MKQSFHGRISEHKYQYSTPGKKRKEISQRHYGHKFRAANGNNLIGIALDSPVDNMLICDYENKRGSERSTGYEA